MNSLPKANDNWNAARISFVAFAVAYYLSLYMWPAGLDFNSVYQQSGVFVANLSAVSGILILAVFSFLAFHFSLRAGNTRTLNACYFLLSAYPSLVRLALPGVLSPPDLVGYAGSIDRINVQGHINGRSVADGVQEWPAAYLLWAITGTVTGLNSVASNGILLVGVGLVMACSFLLMARLISHHYAPLIAMFSLALSRSQYLSYGFFVDNALAAALVFLMTAILFKENLASFPRLRNSTILIVVMPTLILGHPLWSIQLASFLVIWAIVASRIRKEANWHRPVLCTCLLVIQAVYLASYYVKYISRRFFSGNFYTLVYGLGTFLRGQVYQIYGTLPAVARESPYSRLLTNVMFLQSNVILVLAFGLASVGTIKLRREMSLKVLNFVRLGWVYAFSIIGISAVVIFSGDPGFLPRPASTAMPVIAAIAATSMFLSKRLRVILPALGVVFFFVLFSAGLTVNPIVNSPEQKMMAERFYYFGSGQCRLSFHGAFFGPELGFFDPAATDIWRFLPNSYTLDHGTFLTVVRYLNDRVPRNLVSNDGIFGIEHPAGVCS